MRLESGLQIAICRVSLHLLRKDASELTRKTLWTKKLIKQSWLGLSFVINF